MGARREREVGVARAPRRSRKGPGIEIGLGPIGKNEHLHQREAQRKRTRMHSRLRDDVASGIRCWSGRVLRAYESGSRKMGFSPFRKNGDVCPECQSRLFGRSLRKIRNP